MCWCFTFPRLGWLLRVITTQQARQSTGSPTITHEKENETFLLYKTFANIVISSVLPFNGTKLYTLVLFFSPFLQAAWTGGIQLTARDCSVSTRLCSVPPRSECGGLNLNQSVQHYEREAAVLHYASCLFVHPSHFFPHACRAADV